MPIKKTYWWIFCTGALLIYAVKFIIRPYVPVPGIAQPLIDVFPNLCGTFLLPFGAVLFLHRYFPLQGVQQLRMVCISGLALVIVNEYLQRISIFGRTFDHLDIAASLIGTMAGYAIFNRMFLPVVMNKA